MEGRRNLKLERVKLGDYIHPEIFRIIRLEQKKLAPGYSEVLVEIEVLREFAQELGFEVPWDGAIYGYVREKKVLQEKLKSEPLKKAYLYDWGDVFVLIFELEDSSQVLFEVASSEVKFLLKNCLRAQGGEQNV